jgi:hypothetical protein
MANIQIPHGYCVGIFLTRGPDGDDLDRLPDEWAASIRPTITRIKGKERLPLAVPDKGASGVFVVTQKFQYAVKPNGHLTSDIDSQGNVKPNAQDGFWLPVGDYIISLENFAPDITFTVTEAHTVDSPLDLFSQA